LDAFYFHTGVLKRQLRAFRDQHPARSTVQAALVADHYRGAPAIVRAVNARRTRLACGLRCDVRGIVPAACRRPPTHGSAAR
jgi:hypothetical protein